MHWEARIQLVWPCDADSRKMTLILCSWLQRSMDRLCNGSVPAETVTVDARQLLNKTRLNHGRAQLRETLGSRDGTVIARVLWVFESKMSSALAAFVQGGGGGFPELLLPLVQTTTHHHLQSGRGCVRLCAPVWVGLPDCLRGRFPLG